MSDKKPQNFKNHARFVPMYHFVLFGSLLANLIWAGIQFFGDITVAHGFYLLMSFMLLPLMLFARIFALKAQDRVIRLEMRMRLAEILPDDLKPRISEFTGGQLIALRFASDGEMEELCREVLSRDIESPSEIKKMIKNWRADTYRV